MNISIHKKYISSQDDQKLKREFIYRYLLLMITIFFIYILIFTFIHYDKFLIYYISAGLVLTATTYFLVKRSHNIDKFVRYYLILAPIYAIFIMIYFWNVSIMSFVWLLPVPLGVYIFFPNKKDIIFFSFYSLLLVIVEYLMIYFFNYPFVVSHQNIILTDTFLVFSNLLIILLEIYYSDKIRKAEFFLKFEKNCSIPINVTKSGNHNLQLKKKKKHSKKKSIYLDVNNKESAHHHLLFQQIEKAVKEKELFKDDKFNISKLCIELDVNSKYIAKALRAHNYTNFNNYLNFNRMNHVKKLLKESNLQKVTLTYIYTEAGFSNQSTFNRVFKQFENMTPSEYITMNHQ